MMSNSIEQQDSIPTGSIRWDSSWPEFVKEDGHELFLYLENRFGIAGSIFDDYFLLKKNKSWWLLRKSGHLEHASSLKVWMTGLKAFQTVGRYVKPTTRLIQLFGRHALRNKVDISSEDVNKLAKGGHISSDMEINNGYIILSFKAAVIGLGLLIEGRITSQIPRRDLISFVDPGNWGISGEH